MLPTLGRAAQTCYTCCGCVFAISEVVSTRSVRDSLETRFLNLVPIQIETLASQNVPREK